MRVEDVTIVGAGPAGLAAAMQLKRFRIAPLLLERAQIGGLLSNANLVENYPGFPAGIPGPDLVRLFAEQAERASLRVTFDEVVELTYQAGVFHVRTRQCLHHSRVVVVASGTQPIRFSNDSVPAEILDRVYYEVSPLAQIGGQRVAIAGAGDAAFDYALNLARRNHVAILNRGEHIKCLSLLWERAAACPRILYHPQTAISRVARAMDGGLLLECATPTGSVRVQADYLIGALGRQPRQGFLSASLLAQTGALETCGALYWVGDVKNGMFRQTAIAAGDGIRAAMQIYHHFKETSG